MIIVQERGCLSDTSAHGGERAALRRRRTDSFSLSVLMQLANADWPESFSSSFIDLHKKQIKIALDSAETNG